MLPPRSFYCLAEISARWSVNPFDVIGWSTEGLLALSIAVPAAGIGPDDMVAGLANVEASLLLPLFRRNGTQCSTVAIRRVKLGDRAFRWITEPADGIPVTAADVLVTRAEMLRFEEKFSLFSSPCAPAPGEEVLPHRRRGGPGAPARYDWDRFYGALARRIHDQGIPKTQSELVSDMLSWFESQDIDHVPDESSVAKKVRAAWQELHRA
jgi:hypothetical protein